MLEIINEGMISISLSMDAFSLALIYGTLSFSKKKTIVLTLIVGLYHFLMPLIGNQFGSFILEKIVISPNIIIAIIFFIISIDMIKESKNEEKEVKQLNVFGMLLFGLSVSLDSLSIGFGLPIVTTHTIRSVTLFSLASAIFTYLGLTLGKKFNLKYGKYAQFIGGILLMILSFYYLFNN